MCEWRISKIGNRYRVDDDFITFLKDSEDDCVELSLKCNHKFYDEEEALEFSDALLTMLSEHAFLDVYLWQQCYGS